MRSVMTKALLACAMAGGVLVGDRPIRRGGDLGNAAHHRLCLLSDGVAASTYAVSRLAFGPRNPGFVPFSAKALCGNDIPGATVVTSS